MSKMNDDFNEIYKRIDKFCREMFNADKGITSYIEEMKRIQDGARKIPVWTSTFDNLRKYSIGIFAIRIHMMWVRHMMISVRKRMLCG